MSRVESAKSANAQQSLTAEKDEEQQEQLLQETPLVDVGETACEDKGGAGGVEATTTQPGKAAETVRRLDSETNDVDVFLDARW
jgi:hypothetical protein